MQYSITVPGKPVPKGRPRFYRGRAITPQATRDYEKRIADAWRDKYGDTVLEGKLKMFVYAWSKTAGRADVDNYVKIAGDGLNAVAFPDDRNIWQIEGSKLVATSADTERLLIVLKQVVVLES